MLKMQIRIMYYSICPSVRVLNGDVNRKRRKPSHLLQIAIIRITDIRSRGKLVVVQVLAALQASVLVDYLYRFFVQVALRILLEKSIYRL